MSDDRPKHPIEAWLATKPGKKKSELAADLGCHPSRITQLLSGEKPSPDLALKIERLTGIDARELLGIPREAA